MQTYKSNRRARANRRKAVFLTIVFHVILIGGIAYSSNSNLSDLVPDFIMELFQDEEAVAAGDRA
ncbi:MAG: hypothetical protein GYB31_09755 [Bacteroidetes bacterium]|nr:hypothetical protein [Bacteroidota bacterium]